MKTIFLAMLANPIGALLVCCGLGMLAVGVDSCVKDSVRPKAAIEMDACYEMCHYHPVRWTVGNSCECAR